MVLATPGSSLRALSRHCQPVAGFQQLARRLPTSDIARRADPPVITASVVDTSDRVEDRELPNFEA